MSNEDDPCGRIYRIHVHIHKYRLRAFAVRNGNYQLSGTVTMSLIILNCSNFSRNELQVFMVFCLERNQLVNWFALCFIFYSLPQFIAILNLQCLRKNLFYVLKQI